MKYGEVMCGYCLVVRNTRGHVKDSIYAFGRIPSWIQGALSMPCGLYPQQKEYTDVQDFPLCKSD